MNDSETIMESLKEINVLLESGIKKYFASRDLTIPQLGLVKILSQNEMVKITEISERLLITPSAVSGIIDRLEAQELVERIRSREDRRVVYARLTEKFKRTHGNLENNTNQYLDLLLKSRSEEEVTKITEGLQILKTVLKLDEPIVAAHARSGRLPGDDVSC